jgi:uncharacterized DUF497 family protein
MKQYMAAFLYGFDCVPVKAQTGTVFMDPLATTIPDEEHSGTEARWITLGKDVRGHYVLVVHTFECLKADQGRVRLISARNPRASAESSSSPTLNFDCRR